MMEERITKQKFGYTLIELVISMAMIAILTGAVLQLTRYSDTHKNVTVEASRFMAAVREAQTASFSVEREDGQHICGYGVYVNAAGDGYTVFYTYANDNDYLANANICQEAAYHDYGTAPRKEDQTSHTLTGTDLLITNRQDESVFFKAPYGDIVTSDMNDFTITLQDQDVASIKRDVMVGLSGRIEVTN